MITKKNNLFILFLSEIEKYKNLIDINTIPIGIIHFQLQLIKKKTYFCNVFLIMTTNILENIVFSFFYEQY
jgi:hypothetical protein